MDENTGRGPLVPSPYTSWDGTDEPNELLEPTPVYLELGQTHEGRRAEYIRYVNQSQEYDDEQLQKRLID